MSNLILTEEELKELDYIYENHPVMPNVLKSYRELFKANAELSFKNQKLTETLTKIANSKKDSQRPTIMEQIAYVSVYYHHDEMIFDAKKTLEELK